MCSSRLRIVVVAAAILAALAQCAPAPGPFQPVGKLAGNGRLLDIGARAGVLVAPIGGLEGALDERLRGAVAAGLRDRDIAASSRGAHRRSFLLQGSLLDEDTRDDEVLLTLRWRLIDPQGLAVGEVRQDERLPRRAWMRGGEAALAQIAANAAPRIEALIRVGRDDKPAAALRLTLRPVDGAPGDGQQSLTRALKAALRRAGYAVGEDAQSQPDTDTILVLGGIRLQNAGVLSQRIEVTWTLIRPDGAEVGRVSQSNVIPKGSLDGPWGEVALIVADGAAAGISDLLAQLTAAPARAGDG